VSPLPRITQLLLVFGVIIYVLQPSLGDNVFWVYNSMSDNTTLEILAVLAAGISTLLRNRDAIARKLKIVEKVVYGKRIVLLDFLTDYVYCIADILMLLVVYSGDLQLLILYAIFYFPFVSLMTAYNETYIVNEANIISDAGRLKRVFKARAYNE